MCTKTMLFHLLFLVLVRAEEDDIGTCPQTTVTGLCERLHRTAGQLRKQIGDQNPNRAALQDRRIEILEKKMKKLEEEIMLIMDEGEEEDQPIEGPQDNEAIRNMMKILLRKMEEQSTRSALLEQELLEEQEKRQQLLVLVEDTRSEGRRLREDMSSQRVEPLIVSALKNAPNRTEMLLLGNKIELLEKQLKSVKETNTKQGNSDRKATLGTEITDPVPTPLPPIPPKKTNFSDCTELHAAGANVSGLYTVQSDFFNQSSLQVYCDMETDGGGWTVIQRRGPFLVQERFQRKWGEYKAGFGNLTRDFWIGNENILAFISQANYKIRFDLEDRLGKKAYAAYNIFYIANELSRYRLQIANYSGNAGDGMNYHDGKVFLTHEYGSVENCAVLKGGGWWYGRLNKCFDVNVNGKYSRGALDLDCSDCDHVSWVKWRNHDNLDRVEIKIKRR